MGIIARVVSGGQVSCEQLKLAAQRLAACSVEGRPPDQDVVETFIAQTCSEILHTPEGTRDIRPFLESFPRVIVGDDLVLLTARAELQELKTDTAQQILEFKDTLEQIVGLEAGVTRQARDLKFIPLDDDSYKELMGFIGLDPITKPEEARIFIERLNKKQFDRLLLKALPKFEEWKIRNSMAEFNKRFGSKG